MTALANLCPAARRDILALRAQGHSYDAIAVALNRRGLKGVGGGRWYGSTVFRVVRAGGDYSIPGDKHAT
ncbi:recombinase family protein [Duganella sp. S19_KUP01_CR8]|uniref:recombinase family protein n=1 Tax=Duganella sp. S19_KUP01_CR8 TaxID=3025502 RepID=UPI002FCDB52C